jgi:hypothetical protein
MKKKNTKNKMLEEKTPYMNRWKKLLNIWESEAKY